MAAEAAAVLAAFNATLTRIGFAANALAAMNQNQVNSTASLIGMCKDDVEQLMKVMRGYCVPCTQTVPKCNHLHCYMQLYMKCTKM